MSETKKIILGNREIIYSLRRNKRAKRLRLSVGQDASVAVSLPRFLGQKQVEKFMQSQANWLLKQVDFFINLQAKKQIITSRADYLIKKEIARKVISQRLNKLNKFYNFKYKRISIRNQKTRWGSCSRRGNLNFNYRLIYLSDKLFDYVLVHELCHLIEMNHSVKFWQLVAKTVPDYKQMRLALRKEGLLLF